MISQLDMSSKVMGAEGMSVGHVGLDEIDHDRDPVDVIIDLGMLVLESRQPQSSSKGHVESPHCPTVNWKYHHVCHTDDTKCQEMEGVKSYIEFLCRNALPMSIEVMLFPECCYKEHTRVEIGAQAEGGWQAEAGSATETNNFILLEQWIVQILPTRSQYEQDTESHHLLQAVRSFLCFSQISAWLSSTKGKCPRTIVYRVCTPGEGFGADFEVEPPEVHHFPSVNVTKYSSIKVSVAYQPRQTNIPKIMCAINHSSISKQSIPQPDTFSGCEKHDKRQFFEDRDSQVGRHYLNSSCTGSVFERKSGRRYKECKRLYDIDLNPSNYLEFDKARDTQLHPTDFKGTPCSDDCSPKQQVSNLGFETMPPQLSHAMIENKKTAKFSPWHQCSSSEFWQQSLVDLEQKYSCLNLDEIPITECSSFEKIEEKQLDERLEKEIFELHNSTGNLRIEEEVQHSIGNLQIGKENDYGIVFATGDCSVLNRPDIHNIVDDSEAQVLEDPEVTTFMPLLHDHRMRAVSDSVTCSPEVRLDPIVGSPFSDRGQYSEAFITCQSRSTSADRTNNGYRDGPQNVKNSQESDITTPALPVNRQLWGNPLFQEPVCSNEEPFSIRRPPTSSPLSHCKQTGLLKNVLSKSAYGVPIKGQEIIPSEAPSTSSKAPSVPSEAISTPKPHKSLDYSGSYIFNPRTGLPINSSPAVLRKVQLINDYTNLLPSIGSIKSSPSCNNLEQSNIILNQTTRVLSTSAPAATSCLLGNFEESVLNGRLEPLGTLEGFTAEIGASGSFCPKHMSFPVTVYFFSVADEDAPSSYYGHIHLESLGKKGYHIPSMGTIQVILFNPNKTVVKMFVMRYNLSEMPPNCQTFARHRIFYMPSGDTDLKDNNEKQLRYLMHLRFQSSKSGKIYLHTDIRMIFARHCPDLESSLGTYELRSFTEFPTNPRFSPKK